MCVGRFADRDVLELAAVEYDADEFYSVVLKRNGLRIYQYDFVQLVVLWRQYIPPLHRLLLLGLLMLMGLPPP